MTWILPLFLLVGYALSLVLVASIFYTAGKMAGRDEADPDPADWWKRNGEKPH